MALVFTNRPTALQESPHDPRPRVGTDGIILRALESVSEYDEAVALQDEIWGAGFSDRVPAAILRVAQKVGGVTAAAFDPNGKMLGFVFGLTGVRDGQLVHWSDMLAVREEARGKRLGERLKHYQRDLVRALGVKKMYWTFDPLVARNAHFNLNLLKAQIAEYAPNFYGSNTGSILHGSLPTDRFVAVWDVADPEPARLEPKPGVEQARVQIPRDIEAVFSTDPEAALTWRLATRQAIMNYLAQGYRVAAFHRGNERELPAYELTRIPSPLD